MSKAVTVDYILLWTIFCVYKKKKRAKTNKKKNRRLLIGWELMTGKRWESAMFCIKETKYIYIYKNIYEISLYQRRMKLLYNI